MSSDHVNAYAYQSEPEPNQYGEPERKRSKLASCLMGCLIVLGVFVVLAVIAGFWAARHWRGWFANFGTEVVNQGIDQSDLAPQEKVKLKEQVERVGKAFAS